MREARPPGCGSARGPSRWHCDKGVRRAFASRAHGCSCACTHLSLANGAHVDLHEVAIQLPNGQAVLERLQNVPSLRRCTGQGIAQLKPRLKPPAGSTCPCRPSVSAAHHCPLRAAGPAARGAEHHAWCF